MNIVPPWRSSLRFTVRGVRTHAEAVLAARNEAARYFGCSTDDVVFELTANVERRPVVSSTLFYDIDVFAWRKAES